jgi:hypothetical protein
MKEDQRECEGSTELAKPFLMSLLDAVGMAVATFPIITPFG